MSTQVRFAMPAPCPACGRENEVATSLENPRPPQAGDASICFGCGAQAIIEEGGTLRLMTAEDRARFTPEALRGMDLASQQRRRPATQRPA